MSPYCPHSSTARPHISMGCFPCLTKACPEGGESSDWTNVLPTACFSANSAVWYLKNLIGSCKFPFLSLKNGDKGRTRHYSFKGMSIGESCQVPKSLLSPVSAFCIQSPVDLSQLNYIQCVSLTRPGLVPGPVSPLSSPKCCLLLLAAVCLHFLPERFMTNFASSFPLETHFLATHFS